MATCAPGRRETPTPRRRCSRKTPRTATTLRGAVRRAGGRAQYWSDVTASQDQVHVRIGDPIVAPDARRAAAEFWVTMLNGGAEVTLTGILFLRFADDGRCEELREAWHFAPGHADPPPTWGT